MSTPLILKRSAVPGRVPTTSDLQLGELGLNTYDGRLYTRKDNGTASIIEIAAGTGGAGTSGAGTGGGGGDGLCVLRAGDTMSGELRLPASTASLTPLHIPHGVTPSVLENGDLWSTTSGLLGRINGRTRTFIHNGNPTALASDASQAVAEAGIATSRQWFSALRINQAIQALAPVKANGSGASGTWGISISGNAASASRAITADTALFSDEAKVARNVAPGCISNSSIAADAAITLSKLAPLSATDRLLGRSSAGGGAIEEIPCSAAGRALLTDTDAKAQRSTLGLRSGATTAITISTAAPSGGRDGDIWIQYTA